MPQSVFLVTSAGMSGSVLKPLREGAKNSEGGTAQLALHVSPQHFNFSDITGMLFERNCQKKSSFNCTKLRDKYQLDKFV